MVCVSWELIPFGSESVMVKLN